MTVQQMDALTIANASRLAGSEARREVVVGTLTLADALQDPRAGVLTVESLLRSRRSVGPRKAATVLNEYYISPSRRVRDLTERQRAALGTDRRLR